MLSMENLPVFYKTCPTIGTFLIRLTYISNHQTILRHRVEYFNGPKKGVRGLARMLRLNRLGSSLTSLASQPMKA
jgi:hypothetical protein